MNTKNRTFQFILATTVMIIMVLFITTTVFAQDEQPPTDPSPTEVITSPAVDVVTPTPEVTSASSDTIPAPEVTPAPGDVTSVLPSDPVTSVTNDVAPVPITGEAITPPFDISLETPAETPPTTTDVPIVLDATQVENIASADSVIVSTSDPYFMVGLQKYAFVTSPGLCPTGIPVPICTVDPNPIQSAINFIGIPGNPLPTDKKIYVEFGTYGTGATLDGSIGNLGLIQGIIGISGSYLTTLNGDFVISNTKTGFTLSGFTVNGQVVFGNNTGAVQVTDIHINNSGDPSLSIQNQHGSIGLNQVEASNNLDHSGAVLYNNSDVTAYPVVIKNSEFDDNDASAADPYRSGLYIASKGTVTLDGVSASKNNGNGLYIDTLSSVSIKNSTFNSNILSPYAPDRGSGMTILTGGVTSASVTLENVDVNTNSYSGINMNLVAGSVSMKTVEATNNGGFGAVIGYYNQSTHDISRASTSVSIANSNFNENTGTGLSITSKGAVTLTSVNAENNIDGIGLQIDTCMFNDPIIPNRCLGAGAVTITSPVGSAFSGNELYGIRIQAGGAVILADFSVMNTRGEGVYINNFFPNVTAPVTLKTTFINTPLVTWANDVERNQSGIVIFSNGAISLDKTYSGYNEEYGAYLWNAESPISAPISVSNGWFTYNEGGCPGPHCTAGLFIESKGKVTLTSVNADFNLPPLNPVGETVNGMLSTETLPWKFTLADSLAVSFYLQSTDFNTYLHLQDVNGVDITSNDDCPGYGTNSCINTILPIGTYHVFVQGYHSDALGRYKLSLNDPSSSQFPSYSYHGIEINNTAGMADVSIIGSEANGNFSKGLLISTNGNVTLKGFNANRNNSSDGLYIANANTPSSPFIALSNTNTDSNNGYGMFLLTKGNITLATVEGNGNSLTGCYLDNISGLGTVIIRKGTFNDSLGSSGLEIYSKSTITLTDLMASSNLNRGVIIGDSPSDFPVLPTALTISGAIINENGTRALEAYVKGAVTLSTLSVSNNTYGVFIDNCLYGSINCRGSGGVTLNGTNNLFQDNRLSNQLIINSFGTITLSNFSMFSGQYGILAQNLFPGSTGNVIINATQTNFRNTIQGVQFYGMLVGSFGTISMDKTDISDCGADGADLDNSTSPTIKTLTVSNSSFNSNGGYGIFALSKGSILLSDVSASGNASIGAYLDTCVLSGTCYLPFNLSSSIIIQGTVPMTFSGNGGLGILINANGGKVTLSGQLSAEKNSSGGIEIRNDFGASSGDVSIAGVSSTNRNSFGYNTGIGILIQTKGMVTLTNSRMVSSTGKGVVIDNSGASPDTLIKPVTLTFVSIMFSGDDNLTILAHGPVTLTDIRATGSNDGLGAYVENTYVADYTPQAVTITRSYFNYNIHNTIEAHDHAGLIVKSKGNITLTTVEITDNLGGGMFGALLNNCLPDPEGDPTVCRPGMKGTVTVLNTYGVSDFSRNELNGLWIDTNGLAKVTGVVANNTVSASGISVIYSKGFQMTDVRTQYNKMNGIYANINGPVTITKVIAISNGNATGGDEPDGLHLRLVTPFAVSITQSLFIRNYGSGIDITGAGFLIPVLTDTSFYGNDDNSSGDYNLWIH